jgi:molybdopterin synthase sulfur carrier subunit
VIRVELPFHLRTLARVDGEVRMEHPARTIGELLEAIEARYPVLHGTIRDHVTRQRRPLVRFLACGEDLSHQPYDTPLPEPVVAGTEPFVILGAIAGG